MSVIVAKCIATGCECACACASSEVAVAAYIFCRKSTSFLVQNFPSDLAKKKILKVDNTILCKKNKQKRLFIEYIAGDSACVFLVHRKSVSYDYFCILNITHTYTNV